MANDGDPETPLSHRCNIAWGRFGSYSKTLMAAKLPIPARIKLYRSLITTTMSHCCESWLFTDHKKQKINGINSKMLALITKNSIHHEARQPSFDAVSYIRKLRWDFLGHTLRMDPSRLLRRFTTELSPQVAPFKAGSGSLRLDPSIKQCEQPEIEEGGNNLEKKESVPSEPASLMGSSSDQVPGTH